MGAKREVPHWHVEREMRRGHQQTGAGENAQYYGKVT
jgi:hypothetical protein